MNQLVEKMVLRCMVIEENIIFQKRTKSAILKLWGAPPKVGAPMLSMMPPVLRCPQKGLAFLLSE